MERDVCLRDVALSRAGSDESFNRNVCNPELGEPVNGVRPCWSDKADYVGFTGPVALHQPGSGVPNNRIGSPSRTDDPVGYVGSGWPGDMDVTILGRLLRCPEPGPVNRSTGLFVLPEPVTRLAVLVTAGPGGRKVTISDRLVVLFVRMTVVCASPYRVNRPCGNLC